MIYRHGGGSRSNGHARRKCSESHAKRERNRSRRGVREHKDTHRFRYEVTLGATPALVSILNEALEAMRIRVRAEG